MTKLKLTEISMFLCGHLSVAAHILAVTVTPTWKPAEFVGFSSYDTQTSDRFLAHDHYGVPSIARATYSGNNEIFFDRRVSGLGWQSTFFFSVGGTGPSIAFDRREQPAFSYGDEDGLHYVIYETSSGGFTNHLVIDSASSGLDWTGGGTSLAFDLYGRPAIAAHEGSESDLWYVSDTNGNRVVDAGDTQEIITAFDERRPSLAFDGLNRPVIVGNDQSGGGYVDVFIKDYTGWGHKEVSSNADGSETNGSVAIDPTDGRPAIAWSDPDNGILYYAKWDDGGLFWDIAIAAVGTAALGNESLAFDPGDGYPAISYADDEGNIWLSYFDGTMWNENNLVLNTGFVSKTRTSLSFNEYGDGYAAIAYVADDPLNPFEPLRFVYDPPANVPEPVTAWLATTGVALTLGTRRRRTRVNRQR